MEGWAGGRGKALFLPNGGSLFGKAFACLRFKFCRQRNHEFMSLLAPPPTIDDLSMRYQFHTRYHILFPSELLAAAIYSIISTLLLVGV